MIYGDIQTLKTKLFKDRKNLRFSFDYETMQYNMREGQEKPSLFKNWGISMSISYFYDGICYSLRMPNISYFYDIVREVLGHLKNKPASYIHVFA